MICVLSTQQTFDFKPNILGKVKCQIECHVHFATAFRPTLMYHLLNDSAYRKSANDKKCECALVLQRLLKFMNK